MSVIEGEKVPGRVVSLFVLKHTRPVYLCSRYHPRREFRLLGFPSSKEPMTVNNIIVPGA